MAVLTARIPLDIRTKNHLISLGTVRNDDNGLSILENGTVQFDVSGSITAVPGVVGLGLLIHFPDGGRLGTPTVTLNVERRVAELDEMPVSENDEQEETI